MLGARHTIVPGTIVPPGTNTGTRILLLFDLVLGKQMANCMKTVDRPSCASSLCTRFPSCIQLVFTVCLQNSDGVGKGLLAKLAKVEKKVRKQFANSSLTVGTSIIKYFCWY